jgi:hypothetical protein
VRARRLGTACSGPPLAALLAGIVVMDFGVQGQHISTRARSTRSRPRRAGD